MELIKLICKKKLLLTDHEFNEYLLICNRHKGEAVFENTFETDNDGRIIFIRSVVEPEKYFEIIPFLQNIMINQWLRHGLSVIDKKEKELDIKIRLLDNKIALLDGNK